ncbi:unnamed protein product [Ceratitis capitata]|uniref:(Mediterranean fruit fly) hypothetical protein n=1 Tax=Ceratitis capitata TaxID=7213 RepID=A0A811VJY5_CERCA|nr:unnamed protein product [Ceratitis capitata]
MNEQIKLCRSEARRSEAKRGEPQPKTPKQIWPVKAPKSWKVTSAAAKCKYWLSVDCRQCEEEALKKEMQRQRVVNKIK